MGELRLEWCVLLATVLVAVGVDLLGHRRATPDSPGRALRWTLAWISVAFAFNAWIWIRHGSDAASEFLGAYLLEKSLSIDNLFFFAVVFTTLNIPAGLQRRVLTYGILGAVVARSVFVFAGSAALERWHFLVFPLGALLIVLGLRFLKHQPDTPSEPPRLLRWLARHLPVRTELAGNSFIVREHGKWLITPLLLALICVELADVLFAVDSIPAALSITDEPFLVLSSNLLALLGLRSLFTVLGGALHRFERLHWGLAAALVFSGAKLIASPWIHLPPLVSVAIIVTLLGGGVMLSFRRADWQRWLAKLRAWKRAHPRLARPLAIVLLLAGVLLLVLPGPGIPFLVAGAMLLSRRG